MKASDIYSLFEAQQELFEVEMSPSNLKKLASAIPGVKVGMEFEMVVPDAKNEDDDDYYEPEPDYDRDESAYDIEDIINFFSHDDDYVGRVNDRREIGELEEKLREKYYEYQSEQIDELWSEEGKQFFKKWVRENVDPDDIAEYVDKEPDLLGDKVPDDEDYEKYIEDQWDESFDSKDYQQAYDEFREEKESEGDFSEKDFLRSIGINNMTDVETKFSGTGIRWPYFEERYSSGGEDIESIGDDFSDAIGKTVYTSSSYHGARRSPIAYSLEPDSSIDTGSGEAGLEFISPPMPVDEMLEDLKKVKEWADKRGCYTNRSTGLHINVSVPDFNMDKLDYVKLAVLLGDKYVLEQFGRLSNSYAKSALDIIKDRAKDSEDVDKLLKQLKGNVETIASKLLHSGRTDKYTSINTKGNYVEFRSAGGDWLDRNFDKIENTLLRYVVALDAACDKEKYKKEYYKGLYKVLKPKDPKSDLSMFARYMSGEITRNEYANSLESKRKERFKDQGIGILHKDDVEENDWEITYDDGKKQETIYIANTTSVPDEQAAFKAAQKFKPQWFRPDTIEYITVKPFKFGEELNDLKLYRADYWYKYVSVVAKNEEEAKEYVRLMDPLYFVSKPDSKITLTDENASKKQISQILDWQANKVRNGMEWLNRPKIWRVQLRGSNGRQNYFIAAITRDDAINVANKLEGTDIEGMDGFDIEVYQDSPDDFSYEAYEKAQEDLIQQREQERELNRASQDETIDISKLKTYRVSNLNGYNYFVAENGAEAAEIANKLDPEKFPDVANLTVQDQSHLTTTSRPALMRSMYKSQQDKLSALQPVQQKPQTSQQRISDMQSYVVTNNETGDRRYFPATSALDAVRVARREYPALFNTSNVDARVWEI
jgi:hypothetical protein